MNPMFKWGAKPVRITVCVPLFRGIEFLPETVASIQAQTYPHWTCIIGVNGHGPSGGDVFDRAAGLVAGDHRFRVVNYPTARCVADVNNAMCADADTEWIAHLDADDIWEPTKLAAQVAAIATGADIIGSDARYFGSRRGKPAIKTGWISAQDLQQTNHIINSSTLLRTSLARYSNRFVCEDYDLWLRSALSGHGIYNVPEVLVRHRIHPRSHFNASGTQDPKAVRAYYLGPEEPFTMVTAFYEMRSKFSSVQYMEWIRALFANYPGHLVIYTDQSCVKQFVEWRAPFADRTRIVVQPREAWEAQTKFPAGFWEAQHQTDHEAARHSPELYMIWYQKNAFVRQTIRTNPFGHRKFMWCDAGVVRTATIQRWIVALANRGHRMLDDKLTVLSVQPFSREEQVAPKPVDFSRNKDRIGGGVLAGGIAAWRKWDEHYAEMLRIFDEAGLFVGKDQNLFANMVLRWPTDVHVVTAKPSVGLANYWFYLLYYFGCGPSEFVAADDSSARTD